MDRAPSDSWTAALSVLWADLGGPGAPSVRWSGPGGLLPSRYPVGELAIGSVAVAACAARELAVARGATYAVPEIDARRVAASFRGDKLLRLDGERFASFAPLSGFWRTADGWVRTHANYPHHRERLLAALGVTPGSADEERVAAAMRERGSDDVESAVYDAGGIAVALRSEQEWDAHPQGHAVAAAPLMERSPGPDAAAGRMPDSTASGGARSGGTGSGDTESGGPADRPSPGGQTRGVRAARPEFTADAADGLPARGVRVLDLTRVLAGPVATRTLALLGADVLRVDPPGMDEPVAQHLDTGPGKRSTLLDLRSPADRSTLEDLLATAHVVVTAYRPGALSAFGLDPDTLSRRRPDLVIAALSAWGRSGPFAERRGFDSIVQAACGIAVRSSNPDGTPGALPAQALDHATGYLTAAAVLLGLADRVRHGTGSVFHPALARTAHRLRTLSGSADRVSTPVTTEEGLLDPALIDLDAPDGRLRLPAPAFGPSTWARPPSRWGSDAPTWS